MNKPNLIKVTCERLFTGKFRYIGYFSNGAAIQLRESKHAYMAVVQLRYPPCNGGPAYSFSRKSTVALPKYSILQAQVQVEGGAQ